MHRERKKIILVYRGPREQREDPFAAFVPVGLFYILKSLLVAGYGASLHNLSAISRKDIRQRFKASGADAVLISAFFGNHNESFLLARAARKALPHAAIILGGPLTVLGTALLQRIPELDFVVQGEGEESVVALLDVIFRGHGAPATIPGVLGKMTGTTPPQPLRDIDQFFYLPSEVLPHCHGVRDENLAILISARGCPFRCTFCSSPVLWKNRIRRHAPGLLVRYLADLRRSTGALYFSLRDENFLASPAHARDFLALLRKEKLHYLWNAQASPGFVDDETAVLLAQAGCDQVQLGIESVSPRIRKLLGKPDSMESVHAAVAALRRHLVRPFGYFIYGVDESPREARENLDFIERGGVLDAVASPLVLYPGTQLARNITADRFFSVAEMLYHGPDSARKWKPAYEEALARLALRGGFMEKELTARPSCGMVALIASHDAALRQGNLPEAGARARRLVELEPANPWGPLLLGRLAEAHGNHSESRRLQRQAAKLAGGKLPSPA